MILALLGCTHLAAVGGAIPVPAGEGADRIDLSWAREPNVVAATAGIGLPGLGFERRIGVGGDTDVGIHAYTLGIGVDVRHRLVQVGDWHVAVAPALTGMLVPIPSLTYGNLDVTVPLNVERPLGKHFAVMGGPAVIARQTWVHAEVDALATSAHSFDLYAGGGLRGEVHFKRVNFGIDGTLYVDTLRATGLYGGVALDFGWRTGKPKAAPTPPAADGLGTGSP